MTVVAVNGLQLHYQWQGAPEGPVLVLINGLLTDLSSWNAHLPFFTERFRVLTYDCRGQGGTDKPEEGPYLPAQHAEDLHALLGALGVQKAALLGVSNGGCVALQFAVRWPERTAALVLANTYGQADTALRLKLNSWLNAMDAGGGPLRFDVATPWVWGATFLNRNFEALKPFREKGSALPVHAVRHLIRGALEHAVLDHLAVIACPSLIMTGDEDVLTPVSYSRALQQGIAGSRLTTLEQAGHCMFLEQPGRFAEKAALFLHQYT